MASKVGIINSGLIKLGQDTITSLSDNTKAARRANAQWDILRQEVLRGHPWNFALARAALAEVSTTPAFGFSKQFQLPANCMRALHFDDGGGRPLDVAWRREGSRILTDEASVNLVYIKDVTDTGEFDPWFAETLAYRIAADLAYDLTGERAVMDDMMKTYRDHLRQGRLFDAQEGNHQTALRAETWVNARV